MIAGLIDPSDHLRMMAQRLSGLYAVVVAVLRELIGDLLQRGGFLDREIPVDEREGREDVPHLFDKIPACRRLRRDVSLHGTLEERGNREFALRFARAIQRGYDLRGAVRLVVQRLQRMRVGFGVSTVRRPDLQCGGCKELSGLRLALRSGEGLERLI